MCGLERCPILSRFHAQAPVKAVTRYEGGSPSVFIGSFGYPNVNGGPLLTVESDNPPDWLKQGLGIEEIVGIRAGAIRGNSGIRSIEDRIREIALSSRPVDVDVRFDRPVAFHPVFDGTVAPVGLSGPIAQVAITGNARVEPAVERVTSDTDITATDACAELTASDIDVYRVSGLMSAGLLGKKRRFVPTQWAITAVDDTVSSRMKKEIARFPPIDRIRFFSASLFGNHIACILVPGDWKYEMIEIWAARSLWAGEEDAIVQDREGLTKSGYSPIAGAYYSARLAVCEYLMSIRRGARVILVRRVTGEYWAPLGTWVVREAARKAMAGSRMRIAGRSGIPGDHIPRIGILAAEEHAHPRAEGADNTHLFLICVGRVALLPVLLPYNIERFDVGDPLVIADPDQPGEPEGKTALITGAYLDLGIPYLQDKLGLEHHRLAGF
jgi:hypothetical protein